MTIRSRAELEAWLASPELINLLRRRAEARLGETPDAVEAVEATLQRLRDRPEPVLDDAARYAVTTILRSQLERLERRRTATKKREELARHPADPVLGPLTPAVAAATEKLPPRERAALQASYRGERPAAQAKAEGVHSSVIRQRLARARAHVRHTLSNGHLPALGLGLAKLRQLPHRLARRFKPGLGQPGLVPWLSTAPPLVPLVIASVVGLNMAPGTAGAIRTSGAPWQATAPKPGSVSAAAPIADIGAGGRTKADRKASPHTEPAPPQDLLPNRLPDGEAVDDSRVESVAASPNYGQDHTVVALALGNGCACPMLYRSTDGASTWQGRVQAQTGGQIVLAATYPADPRIFIGQDAGSLQPDWVSAAWGKPFVPLPLPPGQLAVSASRVFSAATGGVWSWDGGVVTPILSYQGTGSAAMASDHGIAYVLAPAHTLVVGDPTAATTGPALFACTIGCTFVGAVPMPTPGQLTVSGSIIVAAGQGQMVVSRDGGASFATVRPDPTADVAAVAANGSSVWALVGSPSVKLGHLAGGVWMFVSPPELQTGRSVIVLSESRLLVLVSGGGVRCTDDDGRTWTTTCTSGLDG